MQAKSFLLAAGLLAGVSPLHAQIGIPAPPFGINEGAIGVVLTTKPQGTVTGPATFKLSGNVGAINFSGIGSPTAWIYVTSADPANPATVAGLTAQGSYIIFDHLKILNAGAGFQEGSDHLVIRNSEIIGQIGDGSNGSGGGVGFGTWSYAGSASLSYVVFDHNNLHDIGDWQATTDVDNHCVVVNGSVDHLWVTNNWFTRCGGDSMQLEAQDGRQAKIHHVFFAKNTSQFNRQSGGWVKDATDVVFSQNVAHDMKAGSGGSGPCFGAQYTARNIWFIFNECYAAPIGIALNSINNDPAGPIYILGNYFHALLSPDTNPYNSGGITSRIGGVVTIAHNTILALGANLAGINVLPGQTVSASSNVLPNPIYSEGTVNSDHNLLVSGTADPRAIAPAVDSGIANSAYATYQNYFGVSIAYDFDGNARPKGANWDIGAFESGGTQPPPGPTPTPTVTPKPSPTPTPRPTSTPSPSPTPTAKPTPSPTPTATPPPPPPSDPWCKYAIYRWFFPNRCKQ